MRNIPFSPPDITDDEIQAVVEVLRSGWITTGPKTKLFETRIAEYCNASKAVCLNSATAAMELTLRILGIGEGDEVITSAYTYTATASVIQHVGAKIVMVDTAKDSFEMDYEAVSKAITSRTKVIMPVDIGGRMCDYEKLYSILEQKKELYCPNPNNVIQQKFNRIIVLADAAHGFGAKRIIDGNEYMCGQCADFTSFSFHAVKNLTTAEGGAVVWKDIQGIDNEWLYKEYMLLSLHGQNKDALQKNQLGSWEYDIKYPAYKCNMTDIMASIGLVQLDRYDAMLAKRRTIIQRYNKVADELNLKYLVHYDKKNISSGHLYLLRFPGYDEKMRNQFIISMAERGIVCNVHYKPLPMMTAYKNMGYDIKDYPNVYNMYKSEVSLPLNTKLTDEDVEYIVSVIKDIV
ncbi:MAG: DegT/DnrJ/EryC1/StrS family aminotransferase [Lachnospiraceae bacterium]|nr:DegT/DnrJ/EryC1/StrS family aminotransferase [Lachnospiraceae bacterium]